jgi:hypothetical protein
MRLESIAPNRRLYNRANRHVRRDSWPRGRSVEYSHELGNPAEGEPVVGSGSGSSG